jgi:hypothetical protein
MFTIELDIFSGRPNPVWTLTDKQEQELVERLAATPSLLRPLNTSVARLGYRGYIVSALSEESVTDKRSKKVSLPSQFRIGGAEDADADAALWLLDTSDQRDSEVDADLHDTTRQSILEPQEAPARDDTLEKEEFDTSHTKGLFMRCSSNLLTSSTNFSFWNSWPYIAQNNCYNFASNYRSNTFARPGRAAGRPARQPFDCYSVRRALNADGWSERCVLGWNITSCLVIWPGYDFHFYRLCANGIWCHKAGSTPARNYDNSGRLIFNPVTCNRGFYTVFCGYQYANQYISVR